MSSCSDRREPASPSPNVDQVHAISGTVYDSILGEALPGIRLFLGDSSAVTDSSGNFVLMAPAGTIRLLVPSGGYEPVDRIEVVNQDRILNLPLRRYAPYAFRCVFRGDTMDATVIDLQGRKSINRRSQSTVLVAGDGFTFVKTAEDWRWTPVDGLTWLVSVALGQNGAHEATWRIEDQDGFVAPSRCVAAPPPCQDCAASGSRRRG